MFFVGTTINVDFVELLSPELLIMSAILALAACLSKGLGTLAVARIVKQSVYRQKLLAAWFLPVAAAGLMFVKDFHEANAISSTVYGAFLATTVITSILGGVWFAALYKPSPEKTLVDIVYPELFTIDARTGKDAVVALCSACIASYASCKQGNRS